uniref:Uncharacterized protein n=1 Tax=Rhizobium loti TaxID=381 RepID=Q8KGL3_RHILI|nr:HYPOTHETICAL PROTEIN [Mesorhizobium japonicum R7A]
MCRHRKRRALATQLRSRLMLGLNRIDGLLAAGVAPVGYYSIDHMVACDVWRDGAPNKIITTKSAERMTTHVPNGPSALRSSHPPALRMTRAVRANQ